MADGDFQPDTDVRLGCVTKDGRQLMGISSLGTWGSVWLPWVNQASGTVKAMPDQIDHYLVFSRPREEVTFEGFKHEPLSELPASITLAEVRAAERKFADYDWQPLWRAINAEIARADTVKRDPTTPSGTLRIMMDKASAGDVNGLRDLIDGDAALATDYAQAMVAYNQQLLALDRKFGIENVYRARYTWSRFTSPVDLWRGLDAANWTIHDGKAILPDANNTTMVSRDGKWLLASPKFPQESERAKEQVASFMKDLDAGKFQDAADAIENLQLHGFPVQVKVW